MAKLLFHILGAVHFFYGCYYDYMYVNLPGTSKNNFGGKFRFLTYLDAMLLTAYFTLATINDIIGSNEVTTSRPSVLKRIKDIMFSSLVFPVAMFVGISFWSIYAIDRELILPRNLDVIFPSWLNHVMHTNIMVFVLAELFCSFRMYPKRKLGLAVLCTFMLSYVVWVHIIFYNTGLWVYPVLAVMNWPMRIMFYIFNLIAVCTFYSVGHSLNDRIWGLEVNQMIRSERKKPK